MSYDVMPSYGIASDMSNKRPEYSHFRESLEKISGQPLSLEEGLVAKDFWEHWDELAQGIATKRISIHADTFYAPMAMPELKRYHTYKGLGKVLLIVGIILLFFYWAAAAIVMILGLAVHVYGDHIRNSDFNEFSEGIATAAMSSDDDSGMVQLCAHYMAGTIDLVTGDRRVHLFEYPSNIVTGDSQSVPRG